MMGFSMAYPAAAPTAPVPPEVDALIGALRQSGCEFYRNGRWYPATKAASHLQRKLDYLAGKGRLGSAEAFIADAATRSSISGEAYRVRCTGTPIEPSATWLMRKLEQVRVETSGPPR
jgi:hypothetical protein